MHSNNISANNNCGGAFMSDYYNRNYKRKKRSRREKIGFYTAMSICLIAVSMAIYSTYYTLSTPDNKSIQPTTQAQEVNKVVTGVYETTESTDDISSTLPTLLSQADTHTKPAETEPSEKEDKTALETMLSTDLTLTYPLKSNNVIREYSEDSVYFKTLNVWKPHTGVDFAGDLGDEVCAMTGGAVTKVYEDKMFGKTVEIATNDALCIYSGLNSISVTEGASVETGAKIGVIGSVPFEASDTSHIHISVKVDDKYCDPLSFIGNNE